MITVLSGANTYGIRQKLAEVKQQFIQQHGEAGVEEYNGEQLESSQLPSVLAGATLFATTRLVIIKRLAENKAAAEQLLGMLKSIPEETSVLLVEGTLDKRTVFYKTLKKATDFQEFTELDEPAAMQWAREYAKQQGGELNASAARTIVRYVGTDQLRLANELTKLVAYNPKITDESISLLVEKNPQDTIFQLLESALGGKTTQALEVLENLERAHEDPFQAANMLIWQTNILAVVASGKTVADGQIAKDAKVNPFVVKKTRGLANRLSKQKLNQIIDAVAELDVQLKTTSAQPWRLLEHTLLSFD